MSEVHGREAAIAAVAEAFQCLGLTPQALSVKELDIEVTPRRIVDYWLDATKGMRRAFPEITAFESDHQEILLVKGISFNSICSHHFLPFYGVAHVAYVPKGRVIGLSKAARVVDQYAAQPQTQERLTSQVAEFLQERLKPKGVAVVIEATHTCMACRGVKKPGARFVTSHLTGCFMEDEKARTEVLELINKE